MGDIQNNQWFTPRQLGKRWGVSDDTIRQWHSSGKLTAMQIGGAGGVIRIHESVVRAHEEAALHKKSVEVIRQIRRRKWSAVPDLIGDVG